MEATNTMQVGRALRRGPARRTFAIAVPGYAVSTLQLFPDLLPERFCVGARPLRLLTQSLSDLARLAYFSSPLVAFVVIVRRHG